MSKCFKEGFKYVFTTKKFKKDTGSRNVSQWVKTCNGREVDIRFDWMGTIKGDWLVSPEWCKCIGKADE